MKAATLVSPRIPSSLAPWRAMMPRSVSALEAPLLKGLRACAAPGAPPLRPSLHPPPVASSIQYPRRHVSRVLRGGEGTRWVTYMPTPCARATSSNCRHIIHTRRGKLILMSIYEYDGYVLCVCYK